MAGGVLTISRQPRIERIGAQTGAKDFVKGRERPLEVFEETRNLGAKPLYLLGSVENIDKQVFSKNGYVYWVVLYVKQVVSVPTAPCSWMR